MTSSLASRSSAVLLMIIGAVCPSTVEARQEWSLGEPLVAIGVADEPPPSHHVLGHVVDVAVDGSGNIYVIDENYYNVRVFSPEGDFLASAGRRGQGPGEFTSPRKAVVGTDGLLYVLDPGNGRISVFELDGRELRLRTGIRLTVPVRDLCVLGERIFVSVNAFSDGGRLVRELDRDGTVVRSFGDRWEPEGPLRRLVDVGMELRQNATSMACHEEAGLVVLAHEDFGLARAFSMDGTEVWRVFLSDWHQRRYQRLDGGGCCDYHIPDPESGTFHRATTLASIGGSRLAVGIAEVRGFLPDQRLPPWRGATEIRILDVTTGQEEAAFRTALGPRPQLTLLAITSRGVYGTSRDDFPRIMWYRFPGPGSPERGDGEIGGASPSAGAHADEGSRSHHELRNRPSHGVPPSRTPPPAL